MVRTLEQDAIIEAGKRWFASRQGRQSGLSEPDEIMFAMGEAAVRIYELSRCIADLTGAFP